jgi:hypothetical protein
MSDVSNSHSDFRRGANPNIEFFRIVLGIDSDPFEKGKWICEINLPTGLTGQFVWNEKSYPLSEGRNRIQI